MTNVAVITGAASGLGLALAKACALENQHVVMVDINKSTLDRRVHEVAELTNTDVIGMLCDVTHQEQVNHLAKHTFERFTRIDLLINNAGIMGPLAPIWEIGIEPIRQVIDVNMYGVLHGVQAFLPFLFKQNHRSHIVNMASFYGLCSGSQIAAYAMSKHAIVALSESLYFDLNRLQKPVDVSVACPSFISTPLLQHSAPETGSDFHHQISSLLERSRPAEDVAESMMREIKNKTFYILPDSEVKNYYEQHAKAVIDQTMPHEHSLEKIFRSLGKRCGT